jgi:hypothetical protein
VLDQTKCDPGPEQPKRRPYQAPQLSRVDLEAAEVLGIGCKMATTSVKAAASPVNCLTKGCALRGS